MVGVHLHFLRFPRLLEERHIVHTQKLTKTKLVRLRSMNNLIA